MDAATARSLISGALPLAPLWYLSNLAPWGDRLIVSLVLGPASLGIYQAAVNLTTGSLQLLRGWSSFLISAYGRAAAIGSDRTIRLRRVTVRLWVAYAAALGAGLLAAADGLVATVYGPPFAGGRTVLSVLAVGLVPTAIASALVTAGMGMEQRAPLAIARLAIPFQLVMVWGLAASLGVLGVATVQSLTAIAIAALQLHFSRDPELGIRGSAGWRVLLVIAAVPTIGLLAAVVPVPWALRGLLGSCLGGALAASLLVGSEERMVLRRMVYFWERS